MKDIVITPRRVRREVVVWIVCLLCVELLNLYAIASHHTQWSELYSLWYVVVPLSVVLYVLLIPMRWLVARFVRVVKSRCKISTHR